MIKESLLRYIANQELLIDKQWGLSELSKISLHQELGDNWLSYVKEQKTQSRVSSYNQLGYLQGSYSDSDISKISEDSILSITITGLMLSRGGLCDYGMDYYEGLLNAAYANPKIKGILLEMESGGGFSVAGDILYNAIKQKNKPVLTYTTLLASAAVKGTLASDEIWAASASTRIGSIGTMLSIPRSILVPKEDEGEEEYYSDDSPNKNIGWRKLMEGDSTLIIQELTQLDRSFMKLVQDSRPLKGGADKIKSTLDGSVFLASEAKSRGLIDRIGTKKEAINRLLALSKNYYKNN